MADDKALDEAIRDALDGDVSAPRPAAKRRAILAAREAFAAGHGQATNGASTTSPRTTTQGFLDSLRLIFGNLPNPERETMPSTPTAIPPPTQSPGLSFNRNGIYGSLAALCIGAVVVGIAIDRPFQTDSPPADVAKERSRPLPAPSDPTGVSALNEVEREAAEGQAQELATGSTMSISMHSMLGALDAQRYHDRTRVMPDPVAPIREGVESDRFDAFEQSSVKRVSEEPLSTFSADVDTASYSIMRHALNVGVLPPSGSVRPEEFINYFDYDYPLPKSSSRPFEPTVTVVDSPWADGRKLIHIGIKGYDIEPAEKPRYNLVFLVDVSGSMGRPDRLPLVRQSMKLLLSTLAPEDTVAIAVYAGAAGTVLEPTPVKEKQKILTALRQLYAGGATAGAQGISLAYELAENGFDENAINRVILATDGDFNVGMTNDRDLQSLIERKRDTGIYFSVLGFGRENFRDALVQALAQKGNGVAAYIDTLAEAQKVLVDQATSMMFPIANDVKFQVEFNPDAVAEYRLIGYETRELAREDFNNDTVDAGDIGAGHTVTAIYEITPTTSSARQIDDSRYTPAPTGDPQTVTADTEYAFLKMRYKLPGEDRSRLITLPIRVKDQQELTGDTGFATAVAGFAQILKGGKYTGQWDYNDVIELALRTRGDDPYGYRSEFIQLVRRVKTISKLR